MTNRCGSSVFTGTMGHLRPMGVGPDLHPHQGRPDPLHLPFSGSGGGPRRVVGRHIRNLPVLLPVELMHHTVHYRHDDEARHD